MSVQFDSFGFSGHEVYTAWYKVPMLYTNVRLDKYKRRVFSSLAFYWDSDACYAELTRDDDTYTVPIQTTWGSFDSLVDSPEFTAMNDIVHIDARKSLITNHFLRKGIYYEWFMDINYPDTMLVMEADHPEICSQVKLCFKKENTAL